VAVVQVAVVQEAQPEVQQAPLILVAAAAVAGLPQAEPQAAPVS